MTALERLWRRSGWHLVTRSSDISYLDKRAKEMALQGWETARLPYRHTVDTLMAAPQGTVKP